MEQEPTADTTALCMSLGQFFQRMPNSSHQYSDLNRVQARDSLAQESHRIYMSRYNFINPLSTDIKYSMS